MPSTFVIFSCWGDANICNKSSKKLIRAHWSFSTFFKYDPRGAFPRIAPLPAEAFVYHNDVIRYCAIILPNDDMYWSVMFNVNRPDELYLHYKLHPSHILSKQRKPSIYYITQITAYIVFQKHTNIPSLLRSNNQFVRGKDARMSTICSKSRSINLRIIATTKTKQNVLLMATIRWFSLLI